MKNLKTAGTKADVLIQVGRSFASFVNTVEADVIAARAEFGKPLDDVTDADLDTYFGIKLTVPQRESARAILDVMEDLIKVVKPVRDRLPANDIEG